MLHRLEFRHALGDVAPLLDRFLNRGRFPWGGGNPTLGRARYAYDRPFEARGGASVRVVLELGGEDGTAAAQPIRGAAVIAGGQSGHPASPHYDDQLETWLAGELDALAPSPESLGAPATTLLPADATAR